MALLTWLSATTQCSTRTDNPSGVGHRATSPAANAGCMDSSTLHGNPAVNREACPFGESNRRSHADAKDDEVGIQRCAIGQRHHPSLNATDGSSQMKHDAVLLVQSPYEASDFRPHNALQRLAFRRDDMDLDSARTQRRGDLQTYEARTNDHH